MRGFTLLELMTGIAVMGILLVIAVPSFSSIMRNSQIAAESGNLVAALTLARSEAIKRGVRVSACAATADQTACDTTGKWDNGWLVFEDNFGAAGVLDPSDVLVQSWGAPAEKVSITTTALAVTFSRQARAEFAETFTVTKPGCTSDQRRQISVDISGRVGLKRIACS